MNLFFFTFCRLNILNTLSDIFHFCMSSKSYPPAAVEFMLNTKLFDMIKYFIIKHIFVNFGSNIVVIKEKKTSYPVDYSHHMQRPYNGMGKLRHQVVVLLW